MAKCETLKEIVEALNREGFDAERNSLCLGPADGCGYCGAPEGSSTIIRFRDLGGRTYLICADRPACNARRAEQDGKRGVVLGEFFVPLKEG